MTGTNGLAPVAQLNARQKCPDSPSKHKYRSTDEAWTAARESSAKAGVPIAPYACPGCGMYHLTRKVDGSDVLTRQDGAKVLTGAQRKRMRKHPSMTKIPERVTLPEPEGPVTPGNRDARHKVLRGWLEGRTEVTTGQVQEAVSVTGPTARLDIVAVGWVPLRRGVWVPPEGEAETPAEEPQTPAGAPNPAWRDVDTAPLTYHALGELLAAYAAAGLEVRLQVADR